MYSSRDKRACARVCIEQVRHDGRYSREFSKTKENRKAPEIIEEEQADDTDVILKAIQCKENFPEWTGGEIPLKHTVDMAELVKYEFGVSSWMYGISCRATDDLRGIKFLLLFDRCTPSSMAWMTTVRVCSRKRTERPDTAPRPHFLLVPGPPWEGPWAYSGEPWSCASLRE